MADIIKVSTSEMNATVARYDKAMQTMLDAQNSMSRAMRHLQNCWKGPAWAAMLMKWTEIEGNIFRSQEVIARTIRGLKNAIMEYEDAESENKEVANNLEVGKASQVYVQG